MSLFQKPKTLNSVLQAGFQVMDDLEMVSYQANSEAEAKEAAARVILEAATEKRTEAAHASIVRNRMSNLLTVTDDEIDAELQK